jgi:hypothetical protein
MYPLVYFCLNLNSAKASLAHSLLVGTLNPFTALLPAETTNIGCTDKISIWGCYMDRHMERKLLKAFVELYKEM